MAEDTEKAQTDPKEAESKAEKSPPATSKGEDADKGDASPKPVAVAGAPNAESPAEVADEDEDEGDEEGDEADADAADGGEDDDDDADEPEDKAEPEPKVDAKVSAKTEPMAASPAKTAPAASTTTPAKTPAKSPEPAAKEAKSAAPASKAEASPAKKAKPAAREPDPTPAPAPVGLRPVTAPPPAASLGKSVSVFMFVLILLAAGFWFLGTAESPFGKANAPKWKIGQPVTITLTLDPRDDDNLACASDADIGGKHCEFKSKTERYTPKLEDATQLRPYKTTADEPLLAAGVWTQPGVAKGKRPNGRFNLKCQFKPEGKVTRPLVRWAAAGGWGEQDVDWFAGIVTDCTVEK